MSKDVLFISLITGETITSSQFINMPGVPIGFVMVDAITTNMWITALQDAIKQHVDKDKG